jgi:FkbM family methyltransferase
MGKELEATPEDVRHAYRLFLGREPDAVGFEFNCDAVRRDKLSAIELGRRFLGSEERSYRNQPNGLLREVEIEGVKLYPWEGDQLIGDHFSEDLGYESNVLPVFLEALSPGDHVLDVGANVGLYALLAAKHVGQEGMVYAIEPVDVNLRSICVGVRRNEFQNVSLFPIAASDRATVLSLFRMDDSSNGIVGQGIAASDPAQFVPAQRLDFLLAGVPRLDVIKIDIEGHEPMAWQGLKALVLQHRPRIFSEFSPVAIRNHCRVEPESYLDELFAVATQPIEVLARDGRRIRCKDTASVMQEWKLANKAIGMNGELHLDLLIDTRR